MDYEQKSRILFISTFPPVKCGIASFTQDLVRAVNPGIQNTYSINICALDKKENLSAYTHPVTMTTDSHDLESLIATAGKINRDPAIQLVCIEHEFGLFGGEMGEYLLGFLALLEKPFVIRFHTVLPNPDPKRLGLVKKIGMLADRLIVMTKNSARILHDDYQLGAEKVIIIPHGTHQNSSVPAVELKRKYRLAGRQVLTTFGLLSPNKGIEKGILAMKEVSAKFPKSMYIVLGHTHPNLIREEGEKYREFLQQLIDDNKLQDHVRLINEYVPTRKLMEYLALTDIYLFTSKDPYQAVSGTFLYAMSAGCPIISNSFVLADEMLDDQTGIIIESGNEQQLAAGAIRLLGDEPLRKEMGRQAFLRTRDTQWNTVAEKHVALFYEAMGKPQVAAETFGQLI